MSQEGGFGITFAEKFFGLIVLVVGILAMYGTLTSIASLGAFAGFFGFLSGVLLILGLVLMTAKPE